MALVVNESLRERIAIMMAMGNNGGEWAEHYTAEQKTVWRDRAGAVLQMAAEALQNQATKQHGVGPRALTPADWDRYQRIVAMYALAKPGEVVELSDADFELVTGRKS